MRFLLTVPLVLTLVGCAAPGLYQWGGYDQALYAGYKDSTKMAELQLKLETHIAAMETTKQKVAPGLYAELGTLYLQGDAPEKAADFYARERAAWPESNGLMTAMIQNIERRQQAKKEVQK